MRDAADAVRPPLVPVAATNWSVGACVHVRATPAWRRWRRFRDFEAELRRTQPEIADADIPAAWRAVNPRAKKQITQQFLLDTRRCAVQSPPCPLVLLMGRRCGCAQDVAVGRIR